MGAVPPNIGALEHALEQGQAAGLASEELQGMEEALAREREQAAALNRVAGGQATSASSATSLGELVLVGSFRCWWAEEVSLY